MNVRMPTYRFLLALLLTASGCIWLVLDPTSSIAFYVLLGGNVLTIPSSEWRRPQSSREIVVGSVGLVLLLGVPMILMLTWPAARRAFDAPSQGVLLGYRILWAVLAVALVVRLIRQWRGPSGANAA